MAGNMLIFDTRVEGENHCPLQIRETRETGRILRVNETTALVHIFNNIAQYARANNGLDNLFILAHGVTSQTFDSQRLSQCYTVNSGVGHIQIGNTVLGLSNVALTSTINGLVKKITLISCSIANVGDSRLRNTAFDGQRFCRDLAGYTGAEVIAPTGFQDVSSTGNHIINRLFGRACVVDWNSVIEMESQVMRFSPSGN